MNFLLLSPEGHNFHLLTSIRNYPIILLIVTGQLIPFRREMTFMSFPQIFTVYYGGRIYDKLGAFIQGTYDGADNSLMLDMTDIRYANSTSLFGKNLVYGASVNNSPTLQDVWNSTPSFSFPFAVSDCRSRACGKHAL